MKIILIIERLFTYFKVDTHIALADKLGVSATVLSNWKARNSIDWDLIFSKCEDINLNWLIYGNGPILKKDVIIPENYDKAALEMIRDLSAENALLKNDNEDLKRELKLARDAENTNIAAAG